MGPCDSVPEGTDIAGEPKIENIDGRRRGCGAVATRQGEVYS
jgi:hypothetical protein